MPDVMQGPNRAAFGGASEPAERGGSARSDVKPGAMFVRSSVFSELPSCVRSDAKPYGSWMMMSNIESEAVEQELVGAGRLFSADAFIEASAFGCDSKVLDRAVNRALQKAADDELDVLEITGMTLQQNSELDYVSIFGRARTVRREPVLDPLGYGVNSTTSEIA